MMECLTAHGVGMNRGGKSLLAYCSTNERFIGDGYILYDESS